MQAPDNAPVPINKKVVAGLSIAVVVATAAIAIIGGNAAGYDFTTAFLTVTEAIKTLLAP